MKSFKCSFVKKNGEVRKIHFVPLKNVPKDYLLEHRLIKDDTNQESNVEEKRKEKKLSEGMIYVLDLEKNEIRIFNENTVVGSIEEIEINLNTRG